MAGEQQPPRRDAGGAGGDWSWIELDLHTDGTADRSEADPEVPVKDGTHPPAIPEMVQCLHCGEEYDSWRIEWRVFQDEEGHRGGMWCCPTPGCEGRGFGMDIFPVDLSPDGTWRDEEGRELSWSWDDEEDDEDEGGWPSFDATDEELDDDPPPF